jgi:hypothetical protein
LSVLQEFPYQFDGNKEDIVQKNLIRVAETWMGGARKYFYASTRIYDFKRAELNEKEELDSLEERKQLRDRLQCRNFYWYLYNVIPEMVVPPMDANFHGEIKSSKSLVSLHDYEVFSHCRGEGTIWKIIQVNDRSTNIHEYARSSNRSA